MPARLSGITVVKSPFQCAGMNRYEVEDERALRERSSDPLGPESCAVTARDTVKRFRESGYQRRRDDRRPRRFLLALNAPNEPRDVKSHWIHRYIAAQPLDERESLLLLCWCPCAISSMDQFGDGHD